MFPLTLQHLPDIRPIIEEEDMTSGNESVGGGMHPSSLVRLSKTAYLCPEAEIKHTRAAQGSIGVNLDDLPFPVARDDVHLHSKVVCNCLHSTCTLLISICESSFAVLPTCSSSIAGSLELQLASSLIQKQEPFLSSQALALHFFNSLSLKAQDSTCKVRWSPQVPDLAIWRK